MSRYASICLLSFNRPRLLRQTISTALKNAHCPVELIVHDDGSDQETKDVLKEFHDHGLISLLMLNPPGHNEGQGVALNRMFNAATGDFIVKLDHDMELEPGWLDQSCRLLDANFRSEVDPRIAALGLFKYDHPPVQHGEMHLFDHVTEDIEWEEVKDFVGSAMVIPRDAWEEFGPFEERSPAFAEDAVFKQEIEKTDGFCLALFPQDLAVNVGFGLGPSTVNVPDENNEPVVQKIKDGPLIIDLPAPEPGRGALRDQAA